ncbi:MAG: biotin--[acetyl-CoA-carboxylase] ligase [Gammaproteobacteria bacterium]|nr:biotin--[acetyl-CoA-carboxylase] ligase [Gammaproteobacteria bacterium]
MSESFDLEQIRQYLNRDCELFLFEKTDSTNEQALLKVKQGCALPLACFAEEQTQGRGRRGKVWVSPPGASIYLSLAWKFDLSVNDLGCLSLAIGVAVARVLKNIGVRQVALKWPNDVLIDDKKIAGILIETSQLTNKTTTVIIGIGLNFKLPDQLLDMLDQPCTDIVSSLDTTLSLEKKVGRNRIASLLLQECITVCERFELARQELILEYQQYDICLRQEVDVYLEDAPSMQGVVVGFEPDGEIRIRINDKDRLFNSADISLRRAGNAND